MSDAIRTFIAVPFSPTLRQVIVKVQAELKKLDMDVKWVEPENIHLTLQFLGDVNPGKIAALKTVLNELYKDVKTIKTRVHSVGAFPDSRRPRVIWISLEDRQGQIAGLAAMLNNGLGKIGYQKNPKPFKPHITLGRVRSPKNAGALARTMHGYALSKDHGEALDRIVLFKSTLTPAGPIYAPLHTVNLQE
ncbi:MAG: 2'-5' RNA ligase [Omnitrophica WOR_2 bacterium RIFCSPHIGHO2_02_FULL_52_10]|nr:MAG: 2'-5' RNA ligase [Omnitrophica WOR_2 bacterium RIFCSPHIGHO2_02_FULL_52_10]